MATDLLFLLTVPLAAMVAVTAERDRGVAAARLLVVSFGIAALARGAGSLDPAAVAAHAATSSEAATFVAVSAGMIIGGMALWRITRWWEFVPAFPLVAAVVWAARGSGEPLAVVAGAAFGAAPVLVGSRFRRPPMMAGNAAGSGGTAGWVAVAIMAAILLARGPLLLFLLAAGTAAVLSGTAAIRSALVVAVFAGFGWLALTLPESIWLSLGSYLREAPVSGAAARLMGLLGWAAVLVVLSPWPFHRLVHPGRATIVALLLTVACSRLIVPEGMIDWRPAAATLLVLSAVTAAWRGSRSAVLAGLAVLAAMQPGWLPLPTAAVLAAPLLVPPRRVSLRAAPVIAAWIASASALTVALLLEDEIVLATVLVAGLAAAASRPAVPAAEPTTTDRGT